MIRKPIFTFDNTTDLWVDRIPLNSNVQITDDSNPSDGSGSVKFINVHDITGLTAAMSIQDLLDLPLQWTEIGAPERGGIAWDAAVNYSKGDMVVNLSDFATYKCNMNNNLGNVPSSNLSGWDRAIPDERGGLIWQPLLQYYKGDIVTDDLTMRQYYAIKDNMGMQPSIDLPDANWSPVSEIGGRAYRLVAYYDIGDIVTNPVDGLVYVSLTDDNQSNEPELNPTDWEQLVDPEAERGGVSWRAAQEYFDGDIVMSDSAGPGIWKIYYCNTNHTSTASFTADIANWSLGVKVEQGGVAWDATVQYNVGDIVSDPLVIPNLVYVALATSTNSDPKATPADWQELDSVYYNSTAGGVAGTGTTTVPASGAASGGGVEHCPDAAGTEYPDATVASAPGTVGARWVIAGLGLDANGDNVTYTMTSGALSGLKVADGDTFTWTDGTASAGAGSESWLYTPQARVNGERAGMLWRSAETYQIGDIVTDSVDGKIYRAITAPTLGDVPNATPAEWQPAERGGVAWNLTQDYFIGDVVTEGGDAYLCNADHTALTGDVVLGSPTQPTQTSWDIINQERGGILHDEASVDYVVGDMVNLILDATNPSEYVYICILDHTSAPTTPGTCHGDIVHWTQPAVPAMDYNFTTDLLGDTGTVPPAVPAGPHAVTPPDENGPYWFSVALGSAGKTAEVFIDGFKLPPAEYDTSVDGYVYILSPVADNSWVQIKI